jgi:Na+/proline symporter
MNFLQFFAIIVFLPIVSIVGLYKIGVVEFVASIPVTKYHPQLLWQDTLVLFVSFSLMGFYPAFIQRAFMTQNYNKTRRAIFVKSAVYAFFLVLIGVNGLLAYNYNPAADSNLALLSFIDNVIPVGLKGLVILGLMAAVMSTADSELNVASISITNDVFTPLLKLHDTKIILLFTQVSTLIIGIFAIFLALQFDNTVDLILFVAGFWLPVILAPFIGSLYNITISNFGLMICAISGISSFTYWQITFSDGSKLKSAFVGFVVNATCFSIFKLMQYFQKSHKAINNG